MADAEPQRPSKERIDYAQAYEAARKERNAQHKGIVLPLEFLISRTTGEPFLAVSLSGTGGHPLYITRNVDFYRVVAVTRRWLIMPWTISKVFTKADFESTFNEFLSPVAIDGEDFWRIGPERIPALRAAIAMHKLDNSFRDVYSHGYISG